MNLDTPSSSDEAPSDLREFMTRVYSPLDPDMLDEQSRELALELVAAQHRLAQEALVAGWRQLDLAQCQEAVRRLYGWRICLDQVAAPAAASTAEPAGPDEAASATDGADTEAASETQTYHLDSTVLADCYQALFADPDVESILYLTGVESGAASVTLTRPIMLEHEVQSSVKAAGDPDSSFETLRLLDESDHRLLAHCHNHPGTGSDSVQPSTTDREYQQLLEDGGYEALGLIMSEDGYVRLFTNDLDLSVIVHGAGVDRVDDRLLFLTEEARTLGTRLDAA
jgi:hypothetical protein